MQNHLSEIEKKLRAVIQLDNRRILLNRISYIILTVCPVILLILISEAAGNFNASVRSMLFYLSIISISALIVYPVYKILISIYRKKNPDYIDVSKKIGGVFPEIKDGLTNSIQLLNENNSSYSKELINASFEYIYNKSRYLDFTKVINFRRTNKLLQTGLFTIIALALFVFFTPFLYSAADRIVNHDKNFTPPQKFYLKVYPGNAEISKGDNLKIKIVITGKAPDKIFLSTKYTEQTEFSDKTLLPDSSGTFNYEITSLKNSFEYFASAEGIESDKFKIEVINRPIISNYELKIIPPAYSKLPLEIQKDNGNISVLPGSKISLKLFASRELKNASVLFSDSASKIMNVNGNSAVTDFNVMRELNYQMVIRDRQNFSNINPIIYSIKTIADENPSIELISPDFSSQKENSILKLRGDSNIPITVDIKDDYGFTKLLLNYRLTASKYRQSAEQFSQIPMAINKEVREDEIYYVWDLAPLVLAEGEALSCFLEIFDNDIVSGSKSAKTQIFTIQIPSMDEIFAGADNTQQEASKDLAETFKEAEKLQREMQKISDDLKQNNREISWQEKERVEKAAEKFKELANKVDDISKKLSDMQKDLMQNNLLSNETLEKYNELQKLLDELSSDEMKEALRRMQESLKNLMRDNVQLSMEEMKANEEYFKKSLERTLNLLKRIQVEQKIDELVKRTEEMTKTLDELQEKTGKSNLSDSKNKDELSKRQQDITKDIGNLNDEMNKLNDKMSELKDLPKDQLEKAINDFKKQDNENISEETIEQIRQMQKSQAMQNQQQLSQNMQKLNKQFGEMQSAMQQMNQVKTFYDMMKILEDLLTLSKSQEELKNKNDNLGPGSPQIQDIARRQNELQNDLNKVLQNMSALSQKSFAITPEMGNALGKSYSEMQNSISSMQNQNGALASQFQKQAMQHLNEAASLMKSGMDQMMNGNGQGGGMMSLMQQMQQLSQQQMQLNQMTQMMNQGKMTQEMAAQMQRLAQQQEAIRKSLEQMNQEARESGQSKKLAANLEKILQDMKEVVTNLQTEKIDDNIIKQQEKILSRMLDAQRSVNERDFEKNRKSNAGKNSTRTSPQDIILSTEEGKNRLKDELMKAIRNGYKKDYEDLIRKYFESLEIK